MRKLKLQVHMTVDGFGARKNGQNDWVFFSGPDEAGFQKLINLAETCDTVLVGHNMAPTFLGHWQNMADSEQPTQQKTFGQVISNMRKIVFSRNQNTSDVPNVEIENGDLRKAIEALKNEEGKDMIAYGCGEFVLALIKQNLIDEYYIIVNPVVIGDGISVFKEEKVLTLESSDAFKNGKVLNKYLPV
ncbi:deaminase [Mucilaginibacter achroorhodeus]|uniref:Deaminase n=1 Tax=Mucilaginibacter achroorhodeus TaxID=2599294 RepID=A0A563U8J7_9SPHI|nr:dihydrofolate reductase family protein [Mucilaginibacter achroorhodeus]TWR27656.1 deaminase [Mucilaginibacter achroorhodeus]